MISLSDRMSKIVAYIGKDEKVGDIGTDHAHIPIFLWKNNITHSIIASDIKIGPIQKARENTFKELGEIPFEIRQSDGLSGFEINEIDTAIIAGMGGILISNILAHDITKSKSIKKLILQPRNAQKELRKWLFENGFAIKNETLAKEGRYICEIITTGQSDSDGGVAESDDKYNLYRHEFVRDAKTDCRAKNDIYSDINFEVPKLLFENNDPLLLSFIDGKIKKQEKISKSVFEKDNIKYKQAADKAEVLKALRNRITK